MSLHRHINDVCQDPRYALGRAAERLATINSNAHLYVRMPPRAGKTTLATALVLRALQMGQRALYIGGNGGEVEDVWRRIVAINPIVISDQRPSNTPQMALPQTALCGQGFDLVVMDAQRSRLSSEDLRRSYTSVRARLYPGGRIVYLEPTGQPDEYGQIDIETFRREESHWTLIDLT